MNPYSFKQLLERNFTANLQLLNRAGGVLRAARDVVTKPGRRTSTDVRALASEWVQLNMAFCSRLSDQSIQYLNAVVSLAEEALGAGSAPVTTVKPPPAAEIKVAGRRGQVISVPFQLENPTAQPLNASFEVQDFVSGSGAKAGSHRVSMDPTALSLDPHSQRIVQAQVNLADEFQPGQTYASTIRVVGFPGKEIRLVVSVLGEDSATG